MDSKKLAIRRIILPCILLAFILVFVGVLVKVQLIDGEEYASAVNTAKQSTVKIHAARGEIVDRNGKPIVENRQGYSIVFNYSYFPSKKENSERNSIIISLIRLFEANDAEWDNSLPIVIDSSGGLVYKADSEKEIEVMKGKDYLNLNREIRALGYNIPPLVNAYMSLSPTMKLFGTAINYGFGDVEETGILIAVDEILESKRVRHIDSFIKEHPEALKITSGANKVIYKDK